MIDIGQRWIESVKIICIVWRLRKGVNCQRLADQLVIRASDAYLFRGIILGNIA